MKQAELLIQNQTGLHARPAKVLVALAKQFKSDIGLRLGDKRVNAKSMVSVLTLGAVCGTRITIEVKGEDEEQAMAALEEAIGTGLGDELSHGDTPPAPAEVVAPPAPATRELVATAGLIRGVGASPGIAVGPVYQYRSAGAEEIAPERLASITRAGLSEAIARAGEQLKELAGQMTERGFAAESAIFEAQGELLEDAELAEEVGRRIGDGEGVAAAWTAAIEGRAKLIAAIPDKTLSARADDMRDVGRRVLGLMTGRQSATLPDTPVIVLARELSPSETASFDPERVLGFGVVNGGPTAHIAILARAMGLPAVVGAEAAMLDLADRTPVILNGNDGSLTADPGPGILAKAHDEQRLWLERRRAAREQTARPAVTVDGRRVEVAGNAGSVADANEAAKMSADGIGLLRTEFLFLERKTAPTEGEQFEVYRAVAEAMGTLPVIVRTLDIGGDKPVPYIQTPKEENPFLGERGIRLCLSHPELFQTQLRAILRAAPHGNLRIMFPMVADALEVRLAKPLIEELRRELKAPQVQVGVMIEVPSAALLADRLAPEVDFFSIGTNDLTQYTLAMDRGNAALAARQDGLHPAVLRLIAQTVEASHRYGKQTGICGELGSDPAAVPILVGLGVDELSVSIPLIPAVKAQVRSLSYAAAQELAHRALDCTTARDVRELVKQSTSAS